MPRHWRSTSSCRYRRGFELSATCRARSRAEFIARINVALEEADESAFWLEIIVEGGLLADGRILQLLDEANQLCAILTASSITATEALNRRQTISNQLPSRKHVNRPPGDQ
jgi:hypothetical protein